MAGVIEDWCYGYTGTWRFSLNTGWYISNFCAGNNKVSFTYDEFGVNHSFGFGPGKYMTFPAGTQPVSLTITGWSGSNRCNS